MKRSRTVVLVLMAPVLVGCEDPEPPAACVPTEEARCEEISAGG